MYQEKQGSQVRILQRGTSKGKKENQLSFLFKGELQKGRA